MANEMTQMDNANHTGKMFTLQCGARAGEHKSLCEFNGPFFSAVLSWTRRRR